jgi:hypothetical protein
MKAKKRTIISFQPEDDAVSDILYRASRQGRGNQSRLINEAIRHFGDKALITTLKRDVDIAKSKLKDAERAFGLRSKKNIKNAQRAK